MFFEGEKARVVKNLCDHTFKIGQIVTVEAVDRQGIVWSCSRKKITCNMIDDELEKIKQPQETEVATKVLKALCIIFGFIFFICLFFTPFAYGTLIKDVFLDFAIEMMFAALVLLTMLGYKVLADHEDNMSWIEKK